MPSNFPDAVDEFPSAAELVIETLATADHARLVIVSDGSYYIGDGTENPVDGSSTQRIALVPALNNPAAVWTIAIGSHHSIEVGIDGSVNFPSGVDLSTFDANLGVFAEVSDVPRIMPASTQRTTAAVRRASLRDSRPVRCRL